MAECSFRSKISSGWRTAPGRPDVAKTSGWTLRVVDALREPLGSLDTYHHLGWVKFWPLHISPAFLLVWPCEREVRGEKLIEGTLNALKLILGLAGRGADDESLPIMVDLLELIRDCTTGCQLSHWSTRSLKSRILHLFEFWYHYDWDYRVLWFDGDG